MGMELNTILELVKAGFTKDEIVQMTQTTAPTPEPVNEPVQIEMDLPTQEAKPVQEAVTEPVAVPQPVQQQAQENNQPTMADIMQGIAKLTSAVQANAIAQSVIPQGLQNPPSAEDMLAEIIRPTFKERG